MLQGAADHARHGSDRFEHDRAMAIPASEKGVGEEPQEPGESIGNPVGKILWSVVSLERCRDSHTYAPVKWKKRRNGVSIARIRVLQLLVRQGA